MSDPSDCGHCGYTVMDDAASQARAGAEFAKARCVSGACTQPLWVLLFLEGIPLLGSAWTAKRYRIWKLPTVRTPRRIGYATPESNAVATGGDPENRYVDRGQRQTPLRRPALTTCSRFRIEDTLGAA